MEILLNKILSQLIENNNELREIKSLLKKGNSSDSLPEVITVKTIKDFMNVGNNRAYEIINDKFFTQINQGRIKGIPKEEFLEWFEIQNKKRRLKII